MSWKDACKLLGTEPISVDGEWEDGLSSTGTSGVQFAEVNVDIETGIVKVKRILAIQDCGLIVDQLTAESQVYGGIIGSLNFALFEDRILDRVTGQMVNPNMEWYLLAGMSDIPKIDIMLVERPAASAASSASASRRRCRPRRPSPTPCATRPARRFAACRCTPHKILAAHRAAESRRHAVKAFAYVKPDERERRGRRAAGSTAIALPLAGGRTCSRG